MADQQASGSVFHLSPALEGAVDKLLEIGAVEALRRVETYAILPHDLSEIRRIVCEGDDGSAQLEARCGVAADELWVQIPDSSDSRHLAQSFLIAGIVYQAEEARNMYVVLREKEGVSGHDLRFYEEVERTMLAHLFYEPSAEEVVIEIGRGERNDLAAIVAQRMQSAGEALSEHYCDSTPAGAKRGAETILRLTPLRDALGWKLKVGKKKAKAASWPVPAHLLLDLLPPIQAELKDSFQRLLEATERQEGAGEPGFSRESMGHVSEDLDVVNHVLAMAREAVEGGRS